MPVKRRQPKTRIQDVPEAIRHVLSDGLYPAPEDPTELQKLRFYGPNEEEMGEFWRLLKDEILADWVREYPGTRPSWWWLHEAPEKSRRRLSGTGDPAHEHLAYAEAYHCGIPGPWVQAWASEYYNGRAKDVHGKPIGIEYQEGNFKGVAIDPNNPPQFESEASYLQRHGLLTATEKRRLKPEDFEPETIELEVESGQ